MINDSLSRLIHPMPWARVTISLFYISIYIYIFMFSLKFQHFTIGGRLWYMDILRLEVVRGCAIILKIQICQIFPHPIEMFPKYLPPLKLTKKSPPPLHMANSRYPIFQTYTPRFAKVLRSP
jgi:hypothetical protein